jgi:FMN phosphatase YigB (HAD superfamily)
MLKAVLFDLDNTLVLFDEAKFYQGYFKEIQKRFVDIMAPEKFLERLIHATRTLLRNNGDMHNAKYFLQTFSRGYEDRQEELWNRFMGFYENEYDELASNFLLPDKLHRTMAHMVRTGLKLVIATNPIFPLIVQKKRLAWAGLDNLPIDLITHIENMSFCKPDIAYYLEICEKIDESPEDCMMVGNDPVNDMIAVRTGMKTYLTNDSNEAWRVRVDAKEVLQRLQIDDIPEPAFKGPLSGVPQAVEYYLKSPGTNS